MKDVDMITGTLIRRHRLSSSTNGNPRYELTIGENGDSIVASTTPDSILAYGPAANIKEGETVRAWIGWHYGKVQIANIEKV